MTDDLIRRAISVIADTQGLPEQDVVLDASLVDLGIDSLDGINILFALEDEFDITIPDATMSRQHFAIEITADTLRISDLGSTNGVTVNGAAVESADLAHGDRVKAGDHVFQLLIERVEKQPRTYVVNG